MGKIDEIKETLNTLRAYFGVTIVLIITIGGSFVKSYRQENYDVFFWLSSIAIILLSFFLVFLAHKIKKKTKEIGEL